MVQRGGETDASNDYAMKESSRDVCACARFVCVRVRVRVCVCVCRGTGRAASDSSRELECPT